MDPLDRIKMEEKLTYWATSLRAFINIVTFFISPNPRDLDYEITFN